MTRQLERAGSEPDDPVPFAAVLLRTPFGALALASIGSIPAAALTVGVQSWGDLLQRLPWWAFGVAMSAVAIIVGFGAAVHPVGRRLADWAIGMALGLTASLLLLATLWTVAFASDEIEDWPRSTVTSLMLAVVAVYGYRLARRRVRSADDPRLLRSGHAAKGFLIPDKDPSAEILILIQQLTDDMRELRAGGAAAGLRSAWSGPRWLGQLVLRAGWITWQSDAVETPCLAPED